MRTTGKTSDLEARLQLIEDKLEIYNLIALHPPYADTGAGDHSRKLWSSDATFTRSGGQGVVAIANMSTLSKSAEHKAAMDGGIAHFCGHPHVTVQGDTAVAISYLMLLTPLRDGEPVLIPAHGASKGFFVHKVVANHWELVRAPEGWRVRNRTASTLDGNAEARALLGVVFEE